MKAERTHLSLGNKVARTAWLLVQALLYRPTPAILHGWRRFLLRCFGATIGPGAHPYPGAKIWAPWNLTMGNNSCLADGVICYSVARVVIQEDAVVSQNCHLCTGSHDYQDPRFPLIAAPITVGRKAWVAADAFVGPGVIVGEGAVVGARSVVFKDVPEWTVVAGNPARYVKDRHPAHIEALR